MRSRSISAGVIAAVGLAIGAGSVIAQDSGQPRAAPRGQAAPQRQAAPKVDPKADALLRKMAADMRNLDRFRFDADHVTEVVTEDGQKIQVLARSTVAVDRPNKLRSDRIGPAAGVKLFYDGKTLTVYGQRDNLYATTPAPNNLDGMMDFAREQLELDAPGADLLYSDVYAGLMQDVVSGMYVNKEPVGDRMCHHLAFRGRETDWQVWIEDGPRALPCRYVITSKNVKGSPEFMVQTSNWQLEPRFAPDTFAFTPPRDAARIEFLAVAERQRRAREQRGPGAGQPPSAQQQQPQQQQPRPAPRKQS